MNILNNNLFILKVKLTQKGIYSNLSLTFTSFYDIIPLKLITKTNFKEMKFYRHPYACRQNKGVLFKNKINLFKNCIMTVVNLSREQQIALGKKITALVEKQIGPSFNSKYQGSGKVAILRIAASKLDMIKTARSYIQNDLSLEIQSSNPQNHKNHGSGMKRTILINLSEQKPETILKVESTFKLMLENGNLKKVAPVVTASETSIPDTDSLVEKTEKQLAIEATNHMNHKIHEMVEEDSKSPMKSISLFLASLFSAEQDIMNPLSKDKLKVRELFFYGAEKDGYHALCCCDEVTAAKIEKALQWFLGKNWALRLEDYDLDVMVDLSKVEQKKKRVAGILYCFPPSYSASIDEVLARVYRLSHDSKPEMGCIGNYSFEVSFGKKKMALKIFTYMQQMGWFVTLSEKEDRILIYTGDKKEFSPPSNSEVKEVIPVSNEREIIPLVKCKEEALNEIEKIYKDPYTFSKLSKETQNRFVFVLKSAYKEARPEEYAKSLLEFFK